LDHSLLNDAAEQPHKVIDVLSERARAQNEQQSALESEPFQHFGTPTADGATGTCDAIKTGEIGIVNGIPNP
jgi:hypothetical protein